MQVVQRPCGREVPPPAAVGGLGVRDSDQRPQVSSCVYSCELQPGVNKFSLATKFSSLGMSRDSTCPKSGEEVRSGKARLLQGPEGTSFCRGVNLVSTALTTPCKEEGETTNNPNERR